MSWLSEGLRGGGPVAKKWRDAGNTAAAEAERTQQEAEDRRWTDLGASRLSPILGALNTEYAAKVDPTRRNEYAGWASRGWGQSGGASTGVAQALAGLETEKQKALSGARSNVAAGVAAERAVSDQKKLDEENIRLQKEANKSWWE